MKWNSRRRGLALIAGPSLAITVVYLVLFQRPLNRLHTQELARLHKLDAVVNRMDTTQETLQLSSTLDQIKTLEEQQNANEAARKSLVSKKSSMSSSLSGSIDPAASIENLLEVLERHGLHCISSQPNENPPSKLPECMQPAARLLTHSSNSTLEHSELQLMVEGTFEEMRSALVEIQSCSLGVVLISLEMRLPEGDSTNRTWVLTGAVWESQR